MPKSPSLRTLIQTSRFEQELAALLRDDQVKDALRGIKWFLERTPEKGIRTESGDVWAMTTVGVRDVPPLIVFYVFDDEEVELSSIRATTLPEDP